MAPTKPPHKSAKGKTSSKSSKPAGLGNKVSKKPSGPRPPPKQQKTKPLPGPVKKKERTYTDAELKLPQLNMITPVGVQKPRGKKKGKVFVDDPESMMTILAMVQADREGHIESKMAKARQMEEIRQMRKVEQEKREAERAAKFEKTKDSLRKKRSKKGSDADITVEETAKTSTKPKKRVTFG